MLGLERVLGPEYQLVNGVLLPKAAAVRRSPGRLHRYSLTWLRPTHGLRPTVSAAPSGPKRKINEAWRRSPRAGGGSETI
jgi:hypothetical protein